jgi:hypothetical protein
MWPTREHRPSGKRKFYLSNLPQDKPVKQLPFRIKPHRACEQAHQQLKK